MNKRKRSGKESAEQPPPRLFRSFKPYEVEQVMEVARMLYALRPAVLRPKVDSKSELHWNLLAREASGFLDRLHKACSEIVRQRSTTDATYRKAEKETALAGKLPDVVLFNNAVKFITRDRIDRAETKFETFVLGSPYYFARLFNKWPPTKRELLAQFARWRKDGFPRDEVQWLRFYFAKSYRGIGHGRETRESKETETVGRQKGQQNAEQDRREDYLTALSFSAFSNQQFQSVSGATPWPKRQFTAMA
jgi:hypothetical protein